ncbi:acyl carrier protein [Paenibacillus durus]|uniref:Carrier domain-containing protein n=1 Tax=Paenibacillus durus TaxID=44251 RepID=A0A089IVF0_PAEDU|nr:acyl carrier protein [Paenibacillus durus]AIQ12924.1 hypothetical protein PDUR_14125 [Paenibacillus durus]
MNKEYVLELLKDCITETLEDVDVNNIRQDQSLKDLGANSLDRMDIILTVMEKLEIKVPLVEMAQTRSIQELAEFLFQKKAALQ